MQTFTRFTVPEDAYLLRSFLGSRGIPASILDEHFVQLFWHYSNAIGGVRVVLDDPGDLEEARLAFNEYRGALTESPVCVSQFRLWPVVLLFSLIMGGPLPIFGRKRSA